jgi:XTP/dITP diphosphohydrolase
VRRLVLATTNPGKIAEISEELAPHGIEVVGLSALGPVDPVEETGATFAENASLKAEAYSRRTDLPVLADDSGIEVDALDGVPGVHSARYGGGELDDPGRNQRLLAALAGVPPARRTARFRCVLALARNGRTVATFEGVVEGRIASEPHGGNGFGYDAIFFFPPLGRTFGEVGRTEKQKHSHRGKAVRALAAALREKRLEL